MLHLLKKRQDLEPHDLAGSFDKDAGIVAWQRNVLFFVIFVALVTCVLCTIKLYNLSTARSFKAFVIQIDEKTGITKTVTPVNKEKYAENLKLRNFYLNNYIINRESYSYETYIYNYYVYIKTFSTDNVFYNFISFLNATKDPKKAPGYLVRIGANGNVGAKLDKISQLEHKESNIPGKVVQVYFKQFIQDSYSDPRYFIATIGYDYNNTTNDLNPLGFRVLYYDLTSVSGSNF